MIGETDPWDKLAKKLLQMEKDTRDAVLSGRPKTIEDYREEVGYLRAVTELKDEIGNIFGAGNGSTFMER